MNSVLRFTLVLLTAMAMLGLCGCQSIKPVKSVVPFGTCVIASGRYIKEVEWVNTGSDTVKYYGASAEAPFEVNPGWKGPKTIPPGAKISIQIGFTPTQPGPVSRNVTLLTSDGRHQIKVTGTGITAAQAKTLGEISLENLPSTSTEHLAIGPCPSIFPGQPIDFGTRTQDKTNNIEAKFRIRNNFKTDIKITVSVQNTQTTPTPFSMSSPVLGFRTFTIKAGSYRDIILKFNCGSLGNWHGLFVITGPGRQEVDLIGKVVTKEEMKEITKKENEEAEKKAEMEKKAADEAKKIADTEKKQD